ncbi:hypothetical protein QMA67_14060 [Gluconobacter japonicus]|uniref:hypothetical protein n=1 Tax=Gluconobacter TaxID=441 RepID=UPI001B8CAF28|nr:MULTISPECIES: hypothetical protein [Gluconobacter]MBS0995519.1 hypothetical protein [Gluconobacter cerinus]MDI6654046.1 hypothetical protein [Gluconobacter japonicus]
MTDNQTTDETSGTQDPSAVAANLIIEAVELETQANEAKPLGKRDEYFQYYRQARAKRKEAETIDLKAAQTMQRLCGDKKK